jgi:integrase
MEYRISVDQIARGSANTETTYIRYILEWAGSVYFKKASSIRPTLPEYMLSARLSDKQGQLSPSTIKKTLATARRFFSWLKDNRSEFHSLKQVWINSLKSKRLNETPKNTEAVTLDEIMAIASAPVESIIERRIQASAVFWFLSGVRIGAFISLPLKAIDIQNRVILQDPSLGVRTKNHKYGKTTLLNIPELLQVVNEWDQEVRAILSEDGFWFAPLRPDTGELDLRYLEIGEHRETLARKNLKTWLEKVNLPYHSPHKFRHGHVHYASSFATTIEDYKAISLNVMHSSMEITDQFYSVLNDSQVKNRISSLGKNNNPKDENREKLFIEFEAFLAWKNRII